MSMNSVPVYTMNAQQTQDWLYSYDVALELANVYLEKGYSARDPDVAFVLCHETEASLLHAKKAARSAKNQTVIEGIATAYIDLGRLLEIHKHGNESQAIYKKGEKLGGKNTGPPTKFARPSEIALNSTAVAGRTPELVDTLPQSQHQQPKDVATIPGHIFGKNVRPPAIEFKLPEADERLINTPQLAYCLGILQLYSSTDDQLEPVVYKWLQTTERDADEQERLHTMTTEVIRVFKRNEIKDAKVVAEVVSLAPILNKDAFQDLLREFYTGIDHSGLLDFHQLEGLAQLIQGADPGYLSADDLVKILVLLSNRLRDTHRQSTEHMYQLTLAVSNVLDAMADTRVTGLHREKLHEPLSNYLSGLQESSDSYLVYQAAYAYQALLCVPDNETKWQAAMRRTGKVIKGVSGLVSAVKGFDLNKFIEGLADIQKGIEGVSQVVEFVKSTYDDISSLTAGGQGFLDSLKEGLSFDHKRDWYSALRGADVLIRDGELATFKDLVWKAPCRRDPAFQWGVCQRLGEVASNPMWDTDTRRDAIAFLGEMYRNDEVWGQQSSIKQWILNLLMQLSTPSGTGFQVHIAVAETMLQELGMGGNIKKQELYKACREKDYTPYPLKVTLPEFGSPSLLDRVQNRPDVEGNVRLMRKQRTKERGDAVYIPPQAKPSLQSSDDSRFPLMERVKEFLESDQKVFLLLGDSGAGKSAFNRELELDLWQSYKKKIGRIPLHINLPAIDKPEHDMIAKQLRRAEFSEAQIREMKHYRKFVLICDGYDESQQTQNLYTSNQLNQPGEWNAQMVISCRTEYLGLDYLDRFQPGDRNNKSDPLLFQEAVIAPFSLDQVHDYIRQYVTVNQPIWQAEDYKQALELIPTLKDLMSNPFLMTLSLEVLPRMVDPGQHLSATQVTRVGLYDHFIEQWLERGKKRIGERDLDRRSRVIFDRLSDEGFTQNGIDFLKRLAVAVYKEQDGHPVVEYSQFKDEGSWKDAFFLRKDKQLLREACPLRRNGNQHRFIHRSLLEYGLARAVFDPQGKTGGTITEQVKGRRGSTSSTMSFEANDRLQDNKATFEQEPDINSPLAWRSFVNDYSLVQFLEERTQQEPEFKQQLLAYIEYSKKDKRWRTAAVNAITILVRAGVQFIGADLQGIRIPGADLSYGVFDSAQLQDSDLRKVNLRGVWMRQADLSRAHMTGAQFCELPFLTEESVVRSCVYSPDGMSFATGLEKGDINVYSTSNWEGVHSWNAHSNEIMSVAYSPDGDQIASASWDWTVRLWDSASGELQATLPHSFYVNLVTYSPQGRHIAVAVLDGTVQIWDVTTEENIRELQGHSDQVQGVAYSPDGQRIASCSLDASVRLWNVETGECVRILYGHSEWCRMVVYSPQGNQIASAGEDMTVRLWDAESGVCQFILTGHIHAVNCVAYSPKGDQIVSGSSDNTVKLWDVETGRCRQTLTGHSGSVLSVTYSQNGNQVASGSYDMSARLWDVSGAASRFVPSGHSAGICCIKCSPKGDIVASCGNDRTIRLWDVETGTCLKALTGHNDSVFFIAYSPQGDRIASGCYDSTVRIWDVESGDCLHIFIGHSNTVESLAYSPRDDALASASDDMTVRLWDLSAREYHKALNGHMSGAISVVYSPNGHHIASGSMDGSVRIWDVETEECCRILVGHTDWVRDVAYSPQGNQLATAGYDKAIRLWDVEKGECSATLIGHSGKVICVAYSRQGDFLASGSWDMTVRLWDVATGQCQAELRNFTGAIFGIAWDTTSDDDYLFTDSGNGSVLKWRVTKEGDLCSVRLLWCATNGTLSITGASFQDARGLTPDNKQLLKQRGAIGEPEHLLRERSRKMITMASVVSQLKRSPVGTAPDSSPVPNTSASQSEQEEQVV